MPAFPAPSSRRARTWLIAILAAALTLPLAVAASTPAEAAPTVTISGRVLNADGTPGRGIYIDAWRPGSCCFTARARADSTGAFVLTGLTPGWKYLLSSGTGSGSVDGYSSGFFTGDPADPESGNIKRAKVFVTTATGLSGVELRREARTTLSGVFRSADGTPWANAEVYVYAIVDYATAPVGFGGPAPMFNTTTAGDGSFTARGLETSGDELDGHVVALMTGYHGFVGTDPSTGLVPDDRARIFATTTAPIEAGVITLPTTSLPADQLFLGQGLTVNSTGSGSADGIMQVGDGTLSAFEMVSGKLQPGIPVAAGMNAQKLYSPGNWGAYDYWSNDGFTQWVPQNDIIGVDARGDMHLYRGDGYGHLRPPVKISSGWQRYRLAFSEDLNGDSRSDMLGIDGNGVLRIYPGNLAGGFKPGPYPKVSSGWTGHDLYAAGRLNADLDPDLVSVDSAGVLWVSFGRGDGTFEPRKRVGSGWGKFTIAAGADVDGDLRGYADIVARENATGRLYLYSGLGNGTFKTKRLIANGW